jgi:hypothetical protein
MRVLMEVKGFFGTRLGPGKKIGVVAEAERVVERGKEAGLKG